MTLRSSSRGEYWKRMAFVALLALAVYAIVISEKGGGGTFRVWRPERMRFLLIALIAVGAAAYEFRPGGAVPSETKPADGSEDVVPGKQVPEELQTCASAGVPSVPSASSPTGVVTVGRSVQPLPAPVGETPTVRGGTFTTPVPKTPSVDSAEDAETIWAKAREMQHEFIPDELTDGEYLRLLRKAAVRGHALAMIKLGDYAYRRGWIVEAYYWTLLAQLQGTPGLDAALEEIRKTWTLEGAPPEYENVTPDFSEMQGVFARAVLRLRCRLDVSLARKRLQELADAKCPEAMLYLSRTKMA